MTPERHIYRLGIQLLQAIVVALSEKITMTIFIQNFDRL